MKRRKKKKIVRVSLRQANLKRRLRRHLAALGFHRSQDGRLEAAGTSKDVIRALHNAQRNTRLKANKKFIAERLPDLIKHFASGSDIDPARISPVLKKVSSDTWESDLFRPASLTWAIPVSNGFGRRLRYLVWDEHNDMLIGLIAIGDPVFNLSVRDNLIKWNHRKRFAIALSGPLTSGHPADDGLLELGKVGGALELIVVNELLVRGNLPAATREVHLRLGL